MSNEIKIKIESTSPVADPVHLKTVKYDNLTSKPKINGVELVGDKSTKDLGIEVDTSEFPTREEFEQRMGEIQSVIPPTANYDNQLADQGFVNSSIQTATAYFRGDWATWADVPSNPELYPVDATGNRTPTTNDYLVVIADEQTNGGTWRYKYTGLWSEQGKDGWQAEYQVNETPLTAAQLAALNSGVTAQAVVDIATNKSNITALQNSKQDKLTAGTGITIDGNTISSTGGGDFLPLSGGTLTGGVNVQLDEPVGVSDIKPLFVGSFRNAYSLTYDQVGLYAGVLGLQIRAKTGDPLIIFKPGASNAVVPGRNGVTKLGEHNDMWYHIATTRIVTGVNTSDYSVNVINIPNKKGTMALLEDIDATLGDISTALTAILGE